MNQNLQHIDALDNGATGSIVGIKFKKMVSILGLPNRKDDPDKVDASWSVEHNDGRRLFVWNYKNGPAYCGPGVSIDDIENWSMDGSKELAVLLFGPGSVR